jgi:hypothetical protein
MLVGTVPEKRKNMWKRKKKFPGADFGIKKKSVFGGLWFVDSCFHKTALAL